MKKTTICYLLGIEYPIIQGGMAWIANAELAAAVSNAGGLGLISPDAGMALNADRVEHLRSQLRKASSLTDKPFGVNLPLPVARVKELIDVVIQQRVSLVVTSMGDPMSYTYYLKDAGIKVLHVVASVKHATRAEACGVDAVIAEGCEAGGHIGFDELSTLVLVPQVVDAVKIPVIAAGGIADARGFIAALALGAEGVQMGTRFLASHQCLAHRNAKEAVVKASDMDTIVTCRKLSPRRTLRNEVTTRLTEMESAGASDHDIETFLGTGRVRKAEIDGDLVNGEVHCGAIAGMITEIVNAGEIVQSIISASGAVLTRLNKLWS
ncbi:MAG: nitronate monooxygenase [Dehalococcoidales bacterium]